LRRHFRFVDDPDREYSIEVDPRTLLGHEMAGLAELGFNRVSLGVQDLDQRVQLAVNRRQSEARIARLIDAARRHGIDTVSVDLIYGLPLQTTHTFKATLARIVELGPDTLSIYNYAHLPSRFPAQRLLRAKYLPSADERLAIFSMAIDYLTNAGYDYIGMDHFARPDSRLATAQRDGTLHRCFQGYSTHRGCDILGFGASAISRVGEGYFQTIKRLPDYAATIDGGGLAITRGVALTADDERRAAVIQAIMCDGRIDKQALGSEFGVDFDDAFATELAALAPLERDGLVRLGADVIDITPVGRILLRSIAGVFDAYRADAARENRCSRIV
ncbi:MAG: oxygen-independent coproporphyrinogen III oxidase, partial [Pseudomonadota bacterium]